MNPFILNITLQIMKMHVRVYIQTRTHTHTHTHVPLILGVDAPQVLLYHHDARCFL